MGFHQVIYPDRMVATDAQVLGWAKDYLATEYMRDNPDASPEAVEENARITSVGEAKDILMDAGLVTFTDELEPEY